MKLLDEAEIEPIHIGLCERILGTVAEGRDRTYVALLVSSIPALLTALFFVYSLSFYFLAVCFVMLKCRWATSVYERV